MRQMFGFHVALSVSERNVEESKKNEQGCPAGFLLIYVSCACFYILFLSYFRASEFFCRLQRLRGSLLRARGVILRKLNFSNISEPFHSCNVRQVSEWISEGAKKE